MTPVPTSTPGPFIDNGDGTISDQRNGLMWEKKSRGDDFHYFGEHYTREQAAGFIGILNSIGFAGHRDWRLPTAQELHSIVDYGMQQPAAVKAFYTNCVDGCLVENCSCTLWANYWTSTEYYWDQAYTPGPPTSWIINFYNGEVRPSDNSNMAYVRAIRGGQ